jgi:hypothetical protein
MSTDEEDDGGETDSATPRLPVSLVLPPPSYGEKWKRAPGADDREVAGLGAWSRATFAMRHAGRVTITTVGDPNELSVKNAGRFVAMFRQEFEQELHRAHEPLLYNLSLDEVHRGLVRSPDTASELRGLRADVRALKVEIAELRAEVRGQRAHEPRTAPFHERLVAVGALTGLFHPVTDAAIDYVASHEAVAGFLAEARERLVGTFEAKSLALDADTDGLVLTVSTPLAPDLTRLRYSELMRSWWAEKLDDHLAVTIDFDFV